MLSLFRRLGARTLACFRIRELDRDLDHELEAHVAMLAEDNIRHGMTQEQARRTARLKVGGFTQIREAHREIRGLPLFETFLRDVQYALRTLRKSSGFSTVTVLTIAIGIGANAAIFSVIHAVLLKSLPYPDADRLVILNEYNQRAGSRTVSWPDFQDWRQQTHAFEQIAAYRLTHVTMTRSREPTLLRAAETSASLWPILRDEPILGRVFTVTEDQPGSMPVAVLSYALWRDRFGGDTQYLG